MPKAKNAILEKERCQAWTGDAVLSLFARQWILEYTGGEMDGQMLIRMTSNQFLSAFGNPTSIEAQIGRIYEKDGLAGAFTHIEETFLPLFRKQQAKFDKTSR